MVEVGRSNDSKPEIHGSVVVMLRSLLEAAERGEIVGVAAAVQRPPGNWSASISHLGDPIGMLGAIAMLLHELMTYTRGQGPASDG
jgi:hypothetical protein